MVIQFLTACYYFSRCLSQEEWPSFIVTVGMFRSLTVYLKINKTVYQMDC